MTTHIRKTTPTNIKIGRTIQKLRKSTKVNQTELGEILNLHQSALCRVEKGQQNLIASQLQALADYYGISTEAIISGSINFDVLATRFGQKLVWPARYEQFQHSKVRATLPFLSYFKAQKNKNYLKELLRTLNVRESAFYTPDLSVSINLNLDLMRQGIESGILRPQTLNALVEHSRTEETQGFLHQLYRTQIDALPLLQNLILNSHHYDSNFKYEIDDLTKKNLTIALTPQEHMSETSYKDDVFGDFMCQYKKQYFQNFTRYIRANPVQIEEKECHFHGKSRCIYKIATT